jgi:mannose-6-phosphate isomerase class I
LTYDPAPRQSLAGGEVEIGFEPLAAALSRGRIQVVAIDGPSTLAWEPVVASLGEALSELGVGWHVVDVRGSLADGAELERRTASALLPGDPVFRRFLDGSLESLFEELPRIQPDAKGLTLVFGPGSALVRHDELWYLDHPKRLGSEAVRAGAAGTLGRRPGAPDAEQRLYFLDWPLLDRHKQALAARIERFVDLTSPERPLSVTGEVLRRTLAELARRPFRTRPTFLPGPWGGQWLRTALTIPTAASNLAWSYELIAPEAGILLGGDDPVEVGFELLMAEHAGAILGTEAAERFGTSFPIRFDYLDTLEGGNLSIQCHPTESYMRDTFGPAYTQDETYYVVETTPGARIFLGLREEADVDRFRVDAERAEATGNEFDPERFVQAHPAEKHRLYAIPAGTVHASGAGNVVLEISATPYLYTLRFYDWLRRDLDGELRPVHLEHAFANLDPDRRGARIAEELIREPVEVRGGEGWTELDLRTPEELFYAVHRLDFDDEIGDETAGRCHVLCLVAGAEIVLETEQGDHPLSYAETIVVPAGVGSYRLRRVCGQPCKAIKAFVR